MKQVHPQSVILTDGCMVKLRNGLIIGPIRRRNDIYANFPWHIPGLEIGDDKLLQQPCAWAESGGFHLNGQTSLDIIDIIQTSRLA